MRFKVGDRVSWCGALGTVKKDFKFRSELSASLLVEFDHATDVTFPGQKVTEMFMYDGRYRHWHLAKSLVLVGESRLVQARENEL